MKPTLRRVIAIFTLVALSGMFSCAINPVTGKKELMLISESQEIEMGKSTDESIKQEYGLYQDPALSAYVEKVSRRLVPYTHRNKLEYHFAVLDTPVENAFAAPGGFIYVTRGLLAMMNSEAELATVVGHELGHVNARHSVREYSKQLLLTGGLILGSVLSKDVAKVAPYLMIGLQVLFLKFSRDDEYQADSLGVLYSRNAGYSPSQMIPFFRSIQKLEEKAGGGTKLPNFLSTHPLTEKRIEEAQKMLVPMDAEMDVLRDDFLAKMDGLTYGENPRQGYVEANAFYHPEMKFAFAIPTGWVVQNTPRQVTVASKDEKAGMILTAEKTDLTPAAYLQKRIASLQDVQIQEISKRTRMINGLNAACGVYLASEQAQEGQTPQVTAIDLDCIAKDGMIYTFMSLAAKAEYSTYKNSFERTVQSFMNLTDPKRLAAQPKKISIRRPAAAQTLKGFLTGLNVPSDKWPTIAFLNALTLEARVERGQLIKIMN
ncbi:MAG: M48 family metalloprotease [Candidatus Aminicenantes bacterium]|nr:M48 family metalloprotease [Candidatus Aminicenantes bacterium]